MIEVSFILTFETKAITPLISTIVRKNLMALTGLFLCLFLIVHLLGNLQLLLPPEEAAASFNNYSKFMSGNPLIKVISYLLYFSIIAHSIFALVITVKNRNSAGVYAFDKRSKSSSWYSRSMGILGLILLIFLLVHMKDFWFQYKFGYIPEDENGYKDLYTIVIAAFGQWWYVLFNLVAFLVLGFHLAHGFVSAFKTLGAYNSRIFKFLYLVSMVLTFVLTAGFVLIPIFIYLKYHI